MMRTYDRPVEKSQHNPFFTQDCSTIQGAFTFENELLSGCDVIDIKTPPPEIMTTHTLKRN